VRIAETGGNSLNSYPSAVPSTLAVSPVSEDNFGFSLASDLINICIRRSFSRAAFRESRIHLARPCKRQAFRRGKITTWIPRGFRYFGTLLNKAWNSPCGSMIRRDVWYMLVAQRRHPVNTPRERGAKVQTSTREGRARRRKIRRCPRTGIRTNVSMHM